ncbi:GNAT family N-acetyltransferase [Microbacterium sp. GXS0129]|uniref:GNAT family N-acetyltransferase n=1 Tax=Microbacterium sp. GXS0129 TaxID=3377836 RepID=UPI00383AABBF
MVQIRAVSLIDEPVWRELWAGYLSFYETEIDEATTASTFARVVDGRQINGALAWEGDAAVGLVHWLTHPATWSMRPYCYLEDLFVSPAARGDGVGTALIEHVTTWARSNACHKVYWLTAAGNSTARSLYDRVARDTGFVQYAISL